MDERWIKQGKSIASWGKDQDYLKQWTAQGMGNKSGERW